MGTHPPAACSYFYGPNEQWDFFYSVTDKVCLAGACWMRSASRSGSCLCCQPRRAHALPLRLLPSSSHTRSASLTLPAPAFTHLVLQWGNKWAMQTTHQNVTTEEGFDALLAEVRGSAMLAQQRGPFNSAQLRMHHCCW